MITSETPDKLREIIMDTWPQLFRPHAKRVGITSHYTKRVGITSH